LNRRMDRDLCAATEIGAPCLKSPFLSHLCRALATGNSRVWRSRRKVRFAPCEFELLPQTSSRSSKDFLLGLGSSRSLSGCPAEPGSQEEISLCTTITSISSGSSVPIPRHASSKTALNRLSFRLPRKQARRTIAARTTAALNGPASRFGAN
jgi:hypothetical protein